MRRASFSAPSAAGTSVSASRTRNRQGPTVMASPWCREAWDTTSPFTSVGNSRLKLRRLAPWGPREMAQCRGATPSTLTRMSQSSPRPMSVSGARNGQRVPLSRPFWTTSSPGTAGASKGRSCARGSCLGSIRGILERVASGWYRPFGGGKFNRGGRSTRTGVGRTFPRELVPVVIWRMVVSTRRSMTVKSCWGSPMMAHKDQHGIAGAPVRWFPGGVILMFSVISSEDGARQLLYLLTGCFTCGSFWVSLGSSYMGARAAKSSGGILKGTLAGTGAAFLVVLLVAKNAFLLPLCLFPFGVGAVTAFLVANSSGSASVPSITPPKDPPPDR